MPIYPTANKTKMVKLLRYKGHKIPSIYQAGFSRHRRSFWLNWISGGARHSAYYSAVGGRPALLVDNEWTDLTMAEVLRFGMAEEK